MSKSTPTPTLSYTPEGKVSLARANAGGPVINRFPAGETAGRGMGYQ